MISLLGVASAGVVVAASGAYDTPSEQAVIGPQVLITCDRLEGFCWTGRFTGGIDPQRLTFAGITEVGGMMHIETDEVAAIRLGATFRGVHVVRDLEVIQQWELRASDVPRLGMVPQLMVQGEFGWNEEAPLGVGAAAGFSPWAALNPQCGEDADPRGCIVWNVSLSAHFWVRKSFRNGLTIHGGFGTFAEAGIGWRL